MAKKQIVWKILPTKKSPLVRIGGIKAVARKIAPSRRIGGRRGPSA